MTIDDVADPECVRDHRFLSHTRADVLRAVAAGSTAYYLDTADDDDDDVLLADPGETREDVLADVLAHRGVEELPARWTLEAIGVGVR